MIRINLLSDRVTKPAARSGVDPAQRVTVACVLIFVFTVAVIGWQYWSFERESDALTQELADADAELARLTTVQAQVEATEARRTQLALQLDVIEGFRQGQGGPVRMLDAISRAMPDGLWLSSLAQDGDAVLVGGQALSLGALSNLVANLELSGNFEAPVEVVDSQLEPAGDTEIEVMRFQLRALFREAIP